MNDKIVTNLLTIGFFRFYFDFAWPSMSTANTIFKPKLYFIENLFCYFYAF